MLAGAASLFGLQDIRSSLRKLGVDVQFIEAPFMKRYRLVDEAEESLMRFTHALPDGVSVIPLSEYWISRCLVGGSCAAGERALRASRSKRLLYQLLSTVCPLPRVFAGQQDALDHIRTGGEVVVKPSGLFSGYGVHVVGEHNLCDLERHVYNAAHVSNNATRLFAVHNTAALVCQRVRGQEMSADVFVWKGEACVVRVCRKVVALVHAAPCTLACQLIPPSREVQGAIKQWCSVLFDSGDTSFAQFDFIETDGGYLVPIDFAARVAGGLEHLLSAYCSATGVNAYATAISRAIRSAAGDDVAQGARQCGANVCASAISANAGCEALSADSTGGLYWTQYNCLPTKSGRLCRDELPLPKGDIRILKRAGDFVPRSPTSVQSRVATVVSRSSWPIDKGTLDSLLLGEEYIASWKDNTQPNG